MDWKKAIRIQSVWIMDQSIIYYAKDHSLRLCYSLGVNNSFIVAYLRHTI